MYRQLPGISTQTSSHTLRNNICRLGNPRDMAAASAHLRNYAVAEMIGLIGILDSHPKIKKRPTIQRGAAAFQQCLGTQDNHFSHVVPSNLLLNDLLMTSLFETATARNTVERIFGMGVMAPDNWAELNTFSQRPAEQNRADNISERFSTGDGLVAAFEKAARAAVDKGKWEGSGKHQHNRTSLIDYVDTFYQKVWQPEAIESYENALTHLGGKLVATAESGDSGASAKIKQRIEIVELQLERTISNPIRPVDAVRNVLAATQGETWKNA